MFYVVEHQTLEIHVSVWEHLLLLGLPVVQIWYITLRVMTYTHMYMYNDIHTYYKNMHTYVHSYIYVHTYVCMYVYTVCMHNMHVTYSDNMNKSGLPDLYT